MEDHHEEEVKQDNKKSVLSIPEIAKKLARGEIDPASLDRGTIRKCVFYYKGRKCPEAIIAQIIDKDERTVRRHFGKVKKENKLLVSGSFQVRFAEKILSNLDALIDRMMLLSFSEDLKPQDLERMIYRLHLMVKNKLESLEKLGYVSKAKGIADINTVVAKEKEEEDDRERELKEYPVQLVAGLSEEQRIKVYEELMKPKKAELEVLVKEMVLKMRDENLRKKAIIEGNDGLSSGENVSIN